MFSPAEEMVQSNGRWRYSSARRWPNFKTAALNHSATLPCREHQIFMRIWRKRKRISPNQFHCRRACYQVRREPANPATLAVPDAASADDRIDQGNARDDGGVAVGAEQSRAIGDIISSLVDRRTRNSNELCASLTHSAPDFTQTLLAVPPETNGVLSHQQKEKLR
jgi:hypothetical protein